MANGNYDTDMCYYSKNVVTQNIKKHGHKKTKEYLYAVIAIVYKSAYIASYTASLLAEDQQRYVRSCTKTLFDIIPDLIMSVDRKHKYYPNSIHGVAQRETVEVFNRQVTVDIQTHGYLTCKEKLTHILHNTLVFVTQAMDIVRYIEDDQHWNRVVNLICNIIETIYPEYDNSANEAVSVHAAMYRSMLKLRSNEEPLHTSEWIELPPTDDTMEEPTEES